MNSMESISKEQIDLELILNYTPHPDFSAILIIP